MLGFGLLFHHVLVLLSICWVLADVRIGAQGGGGDSVHLSSKNTSSVKRQRIGGLFMFDILHVELCSIMLSLCSLYLGSCSIHFLSPVNNGNGKRSLLDAVFILSW